MPQFQFSRLNFYDNIELFSSESENAYFPFHLHDIYCVSLITNGTEILNNTEQEFIAPTGSISITQANEVHRNYSLNDAGYSYKTLYINPNVLKYFNNNKDIQHLERVIYSPSLYKMMMKLFSLNGDKNGILQQCFNELTRYSTIPEQKKNWRNTFSRIDEIINDYLDSPIDADWLAKQFYMSKFHFIREFKKAKGVTPQNYIMLCRLGKAKKLLLNNVPVNEVAYLNGFYDASHFINNFKKFFGITPSLYSGSLLILKK